jgi:putative flippase GtrA
MGGLLLFTEVFGFYYLISKVITSTIVGIIFNYNIQRTFVFKTKDSI